MIDVASSAIVLGASGGLGSAMVAEFLNDPAVGQVFAISSKQQPSGLGDPKVLEN